MWMKLEIEKNNIKSELEMDFSVWKDFHSLLNVGEAKKCQKANFFNK